MQCGGPHERTTGPTRRILDELIRRGSARSRIRAREEKENARPWQRARTGRSFFPSLFGLGAFLDRVIVVVLVLLFGLASHILEASSAASQTTRDFGCTEWHECR